MLRPYVRRPKRRVPNPSGHDGADAVRQGLGRARRPSAPGGPGAPVRGPASGARGDVAAGVRGVAAGGAPGAPTGADGGDGGSQRPHRRPRGADRKSTRLNSSHVEISYAVFCLKKKKENLAVAELREDEVGVGGGVRTWVAR